MSSTEFETIEAAFRKRRRETTGSFDLEAIRAGVELTFEYATPVPGTYWEWETMGGVACLRVLPTPITSDMEILFLHGGAYCLGSPMSHHRMAAHLAKATGAAVLLPDYRLAPEAPFPAGRDDCIAVLDHRLQNARRNLMLAGDSAGAGLALCALNSSRLQLLPNAMGMMCPWFDLSLSGASVEENAQNDFILARENLERFAGFYADRESFTSAKVSPLFAPDTALPPTYLQAAGYDLLRDDALRFAARHPAIQLDVFDGMPHGFQMFAGRLPQASDALNRLAQFFVQHDKG